MTIDTYKTLGQAAPAASTTTTVYTAPNPGGAIISSVVIVNRGTTTQSFSLAYTDSVGTFLAGVPTYQRIGPKETITIVGGITLGPGQRLLLFANPGASDLSINVFGVEKTSLTNEAPKILGGLNGVTANTLTDLYTVPAATSAVVSSIGVSNYDGTTTAQTWRAAVSVGGGAIANKDYLFYDQPLAANPLTLTGADGSWALITLGITLAAGDKVRVLGTDAEMDFILFGTELT